MLKRHDDDDDDGGGWHKARAAFWERPMRPFTAQEFRELVAELQHVARFEILRRQGTSPSVRGSARKQGSSSSGLTKTHRRGVVSRSLLQVVSPLFWSISADGGRSEGWNGSSGGGAGTSVGCMRGPTVTPSQGRIVLFSREPRDMASLASLILRSGATPSELHEDARRTFVRHFQDLRLTFLWVNTGSATGNDSSARVNYGPDREVDACLMEMSRILLGNVVNARVLVEAPRMFGLRLLNDRFPGYAAAAAQPRRPSVSSAAPWSAPVFSGSPIAVSLVSESPRTSASTYYHSRLRKRRCAQTLLVPYLLPAKC